MGRKSFPGTRRRGWIEDAGGGLLLAPAVQPGAACYCVFLLTEAGDVLAGRARYSSIRCTMISRGIEHRAFETLCPDVRKSPAPAKYRGYFPDRGIGPDLRAFALEAILLQDARHEADYDPRRRFRRQDARLTIDQARRRRTHWGRPVPDDEWLFVTLMAFAPS